MSLPPPSATPSWRESLVAPHITVRDALVAMGRGHSAHILLVVDEAERLLGTVTDGDIRRALLRSMDLDVRIDVLMNSRPRTVPPGADRDACLAVMRDHVIHQLPVVDTGGRVVGLVRLDDLLEAVAPLPNRVVVLAGGLGTRLLPLTETRPKPMLSVGGQPILETILRQLAGNGFRHVFLSVNYLSDQIREHFADGSRLGLDVRYLNEERPLGTAGPLALLPEPSTEPLLVLNGDILTKLDFSALLSYHRSQGARATVCVREFDLTVPYGVVEVGGGLVRAITEKPVHQFLVNAGIYVLDPAAAARVPRGVATDMPDLIRSLVDDGEPVAGYPIHEYWIDIGRMEDFSRASREYGTIFA